VPPAVTLFAILGFGALFGVMGVLLAAPLAVTVHVLVTEFWARRLPPPAPVTPTPTPTPTPPG
jgi:predicted PurR-regulated permease PerM